jgi:hypothetical protein
VSPLFGGVDRDDSATVKADGATLNGTAPLEQSEGQLNGLLGSASSLTASRPEIVVAAAFAGGVALAILARRLGR